MLDSITGNIFNVQRFSTSDGPGIRTTVFLKGCPLNCSWCHNPESKCSSPEIFFKSDICLACRRCEIVCPNGCHTFENGEHIFDRFECTACGKCSNECSAKALERCGYQATADEIIEIVKRDVAFYEQSGGGMTLSGGEPLLQYDFSLALLRLAKQNGIHTAIETGGYSKNNLNEINRYTDLWLFDIKLTDPVEFKKHIGYGYDLIFDNLRYLDSLGAKIILRCPVIPDINMNEQHIDAIANICNSLDNVREIHLEPYHPLGLSKSEQLGKAQTYKNDKFLAKEDIEHLYNKLVNSVSVKVSII